MDTAITITCVHTNTQLLRAFNAKHISFYSKNCIHLNRKFRSNQIFWTTGKYVRNNLNQNAIVLDKHIHWIAVVRYTSLLKVRSRLQTQSSSSNLFYCDYTIEKRHSLPGVKHGFHLRYINISRHPWECSCSGIKRCKMPQWSNSWSVHACTKCQLSSRVAR